MQLFADYKANCVSTEFGSVKPNIRGGYEFANLNKCLPAYINDAIIEGILDRGCRVIRYRIPDIVTGAHRA